MIPIMKALLQTGLGGRVSVPSEKRFLIIRNVALGNVS